MSTSASRRAHGVVTGDSLATYLREIGAYPPLTRTEEIALARRIRAGDDAALDRLVCANLRFVVALTKRYRRQGTSLGDLISEGNVGLLRAARRFDEEKGVKFISYAVWWIRQAIFESLAEQDETVRVPTGRAGSLRRIHRDASALCQELGRDATQHEVAATLGVSAEDASAGLRGATHYLSLEAPIAEGEDGRLLDYIADEVAPAPDVGVVDRALAESVTKAFGRLRDREVKVLHLYFGFDEREPMTLEQIGATLGITRERVRQIKERALSRLRRSPEANVLAPFQTR